MIHKKFFKKKNKSLKFNYNIPIFRCGLATSSSVVHTKDNIIYNISQNHGFIKLTQDQLLDMFVLDRGCVHGHITNVWNNIYQCIYCFTLINRLMKQGKLPVKELGKTIKNICFLYYQRIFDVIFTVENFKEIVGGDIVRETILYNM